MTHNIPRLPFFEFFSSYLKDGQIELVWTGASDFWQFIHTSFEVWLGYEDSLQWTIKDYQLYAEKGYWHSKVEGDKITIYPTKKLLDYLKTFQ